MKITFHITATILTLLTFGALKAEAQSPIDSGNSSVQQLQSGWTLGVDTPPSVGGSSLHYLVVEAGGYVSVSDPSLPSGEGILIDCAVFHELYAAYMMRLAFASSAVEAGQDTLDGLLRQQAEEGQSERLFLQITDAIYELGALRGLVVRLRDDLALLDSLMELAGC